MARIVEPLLHTAEEISPAPPPPVAQPPVAQPPVAAAPPAPPPVPLSPAQVAAHFRNVNAGLPDGVMYEPLDKAALAAFKTAAAIPAPAPEAAPAPEKKEAAVSADTLRQLAQDERNAHVFYASYAQLSEKKQVQEALASAAHGAAGRLSAYARLLSALHGQRFTPEDKEIALSLPEPEAIKLAAREEANAAHGLALIILQAGECPTVLPLAVLLAEKVVAHRSITLLL